MEKENNKTKLKEISVNDQNQHNSPLESLTLKYEKDAI